MTKRKWLTALSAAALAVWVGCQKAPEAEVSQTPAPQTEQVVDDSGVAPQVDVAPADSAHTLLVTLDVPNMV